MASVDPQCDICQLRNISKPAVNWCSECEESICSECNEHHSLAKALRNHKTISIADYQNLPSSALNIKHYCEDHDDKLEFYCPIHAAACCVKCIEVTHHDCREIKSLRDAIKDIKSSAVVLEFETNLSEVLDVYKRIKEDKVKNSKHIDQQASHFKEDILNLRRQVESHLDILEKDLLSSLEAHKSNCKDKILKFTSLLDEKTTRIENTIDNITKYKQHASELQTFLGLSEIEKTIQEDREFIKSMETESDFHNFELQLEISPAFESFKTSVTSLGSIIAEKINSSVQIALKSDKQAQIQRPNQMSEIDDIDKVTLTKIVEFNVKENATGNINITGCEILDNNKILLANYGGNELLMYTEQGKFEEKTEMSYGPYDISYINNQKVAVSSNYSKAIYIYDMELRKTVNQTATKNYALGLHFYDEKIFCRVSSFGIQVFSSTLDLMSSIKFSSSSTSHISLSYGHIFYSERLANHVICCDMNGKEVWRSDEPSLTREVYGLSCGRHGSVFVTNKKDNIISIISNGGKKIRTILGSKDGLVSPFCLHFNCSNNQLLVCNKQNGIVFMYNVNAC